MGIPQMNTENPPEEKPKNEPEGNPLEELKKDTGYDETRDLEFYQFPEVNGRIHLKKGDFAVVSPDDGHQPRCIGKAPCKVKKIVVKVKVD